MRKDAKVLFGVGGVLLAVLVVYFVSTSKKKTVTPANSVAVVPAQDTTPVTPTAPVTPAEDRSLISGPTTPTTTPPTVTPVDPATIKPVDVGTGSELASKTVGPDKLPAELKKPDKVDGSGLLVDGGVKPRSTESVYTVKENQTLSAISLERYGTSKHWKEIQDANPTINPKRLHAGDKINLPEIVITKSDHKADTNSGLALAPGMEGVIPLDQQQLHSTELASDTTIRGGGVASSGSHPSDGRTAPAPAVGQVYTVQSGDSLYKISKRVYHTGQHADAIYEANKAAIGPDKARLKLDMKLVIPALPEVVRSTVTDASH